MLRLEYLLPFFDFFQIQYFHRSTPFRLNGYNILNTSVLPGINQCNLQISTYP